MNARITLLREMILEEKLKVLRRIRERIDNADAVIISKQGNREGISRSARI